MMNILRINALVLYQNRQSVSVSCTADTREANTCQTITVLYSSSTNNIIQVFNYVLENVHHENASEGSPNTTLSVLRERTAILHNMRM
jgi:hypothetical protein